MRDSLRWLVALQIVVGLHDRHRDSIEQRIGRILVDQLFGHLLAARGVSGLCQQVHH